MSQRRRGGVTLLEVAAARVGFWKATQVVAFVASWGIAEVMRGHPLDVQEYAEFSELSRAQAFRRQQLFRKAFPGEDTPSRMLATIRAEAGVELVEPERVAGSVLPGLA